ncbi:hypothetical protein L682_07190 [Aquipseudomonas alcaligenes OT 69]|nr:hypothetical protein L682_07190 [Pseudomonas alcaligenes OT 69]
MVFYVVVNSMDQIPGESDIKLLSLAQVSGYINVDYCPNTAFICFIFRMKTDRTSLRNRIPKLR